MSTRAVRLNKFLQEYQGKMKDLRESKPINK